MTLKMVVGKRIMFRLNSIGYKGSKGSKGNDGIMEYWKNGKREGLRAEGGEEVK